VAIPALTPLTDLLATVAGELGPVGVPVHTDYPDAVEPPCLIVIWDTPSLDPPRSLGGVVTDGHVAILVIVGRVEAGPGRVELEALTVAVLAAMRQAPWAFTGANLVQELTIAGIQYLGARIGYRVPTAT